MTLSKRIMRWLDPQGEEIRQRMRYNRSCVEANAEDLARTISMHSDTIQRIMREHKAKANGSDPE